MRRHASFEAISRNTLSTLHAGHAVRRNRTRSAAGKLDFVEGDYSARRASDDVAVSAQDQVGRGRVAGEAQVLGNGGARVEVPFRATLARLGVVAHARTEQQWQSAGEQLPTSQPPHQARVYPLVLFMDRGGWVVFNPYRLYHKPPLFHPTVSTTGG